MWPVVGGAISGGLDFAGGVLGQQNAKAINTANINAAQNAAMFGLSWRVADAKRAGINPLAALGSNFSPGPATEVASNQFGEGLSKAGQDISRALQAYADQQSKAAQLDVQYKQAMIDQVNATTAGQMLLNSKAARTFAAPGTPPGVNVPMPQADPRYTSEVLPGMTRFLTRTGIVAAPSAEFTRSTFSIDPAGPAHAMNIEAGNVPEWHVRPDVLRGILQNTFRPYDPSAFGGGM